MVRPLVRRPAFLELSGLFVLGLGWCFQHLGGAGSRLRPWVVGWTVLSVLFSWLLMLLYILEKISRLEPLL